MPTLQQQPFGPIRVSASITDKSWSWQRWTGVGVCLFFGILRAWIGRYSLNPDGVSYLDLSDAFLRHDWHAFWNAYWSPLYPILLGIEHLVLPTSKRWELPTTHVLNFVIFALALASFEFFYVSLRKSFLIDSGDEQNGRLVQMCEPAFWLIAHAVFLWVSLDLITVWDVGADLLVSVFVYCIAGLILRCGPDSNWKLHAALGIALGASYWAKAVMFPLAFGFMGIALLRAPSVRGALKRALTMVATFSLIALPLVAVLSAQKHRLTFGDSGRINYAYFVSPGGVPRNWQGEPKWGITGPHTTRKIFDSPPIYEFAEPVGGTFPPFYDPSYWQEGRVPRFRLVAQLSVIGRHLLFYGDLLLRQENALLAAFLTFLWAAGKRASHDIGRMWPLLLLAAAPFALYMLVHAETRFLGAYVAILWIVLISPLRIDIGTAAIAKCLLYGVSAALLLTVTDNTARAIREGGPFSGMPQIVLSDRLDASHLRVGDRIANIGDPGIYAARLSHLKIVAEIMEKDSAAFWKLPSDKKENIYRIMAQTGARMIVASDPGSSVELDSSWLRTGGGVLLRPISR